MMKLESFDLTWKEPMRFDDELQLKLKIQIDIRKVMRRLTLNGLNETCTMHVEVTSKVDVLESKRTVHGL